ncbi:hypothetical protein PAXRUDRAFT_821593 [Paxillus rubicundulus Ve08.2h10]|uniref:Uncharacterized protein n=1 Tax=Paxillus rubicundulus Ve08.2h10 TaxID=930991 RepID=A0A0D0EAN9_9AGAM|nr:hypothetical protein PAXRUDRAFT_821593 [Paxillus rubicundulus Ve08.2h10]
MSSVRSQAAVAWVKMGPREGEASTDGTFGNEDHGDIGLEPLSQPLVNVSEDMCLIFNAPKPQACPILSPTKISSVVMSPEEYSQAPLSKIQAASSLQPSSEFLASLGIKVRDFAYENTLPAIAPVPRMPRQVQPAPRALKRSQRDWEDAREDLQGSHSIGTLSGPQPFQSRRTPSKSLERKPTEPLEQGTVQYTRTLERIAIYEMRSIVSSIQATAFPATRRQSLSASPPTSPITPSLPQVASQESELVQTPPAIPFIIHMDDTSTIPASQLDSESQAMSVHPMLFSQFALSPQPSPRPSSPDFTSHSPLPQQASPSGLVDPFLELLHPVDESGKGCRGRKNRDRGTVSATPSSNRYELRQRPILSSRTSTLYAPYPLLPPVKRTQRPTSKSLPQRTRHGLR